MMLKRLILAPALAALMALPAQAEKLSLDAISSYINGLKTAEAEFRQINADGSTSSGRVLIASVMPDSAALKAGLKGGDEVLSADGKPVSRSSDLVG